MASFFARKVETDVEFWHNPDRSGWLMKQGERAREAGALGRCGGAGAGATRRARATLHARACCCTLLRKRTPRCCSRATQRTPLLPLPCDPPAGEYIKTWRRR